MTDQSKPEPAAVPGNSVVTSAPPEGLKAWFESQAHRVESILHEAAQRVEAQVEVPVKSAETAVSAVIGEVGKVEGDVVQDLKALVEHLHTKYDAVVERVRKLESHLGFA